MNKGEFEELMFWGRIEGLEADYYVCMGITYSQKYEFPEKCFYWASSDDYIFKAFSTLNDQHDATIDELASVFTGNPKQIHVQVEPEISPETAEEIAAREAEPEPSLDPLASTEEEDPNAGFVPRNLTELDRLQYTILAIENDCHIIPKGSMRLTDQHEVRHNTAWCGLSAA